MFILFACEEKPEEAKIGKSIKTLEAVKENDSTFLLKGEITMGNTESTIEYGFKIYESLNQANSKFINLGVPQGDGTFEYRYVAKTPLKKYYFKAYMETNISSKIYGVQSSFLMNPNITSVGPRVISDLSIISIKGKGFESLKKDLNFILYTKKDYGSLEDKNVLTITSINDTLITVRTPTLLGTDPVKPYFTGKIPPSELIIRNSSDSSSFSLDNFQYQYDFYVDQNTKKGKVGDVFYIYTFYSRKTPAPSELTYLFEATQIKPESAEARFDYTVEGQIFGYKLKFKVPIGFSPGKVKVKITSAFGDEFRVRNAGSEEFEVL